MEYFQLQPHSATVLAEILLGSVPTLYLLSLKSKSKDTWRFIGFMGVLTLFYITDFLQSAFPRAPWVSSIWQWHDWLIGIATVYLTWFSYEYRHNPYRREMYVVLSLNSTMVVYALLTQWRNAIWSDEPWLIVIAGWSVVVFVRKFVWASALSKNKSSNQEQKAFQSFILSNTLAVIIYLNAFLGFEGITALVPISGFLHQFFILIFTTWSFINYVNFAQERTTFQAKLVGLFLCVVLTVLGTTGLLMFAVWNPNVPEQPAQYIINNLAITELVVTGLILLVFPLFFRSTLLRPLKAVLTGVQAVNTGNLMIEVPVEVRDEIGFLTQNFNQMTQSLRHSKEELLQYAATLEEKVDQRTQELKKSLHDLKTIQAQLIQKEKMASLGELTAGIAHEIQNPLNFVNNFAEVSIELAEELRERIQSGDDDSVLLLSTDLRDNMQHIVQNGQRASSIVRAMLEHSRSSTGERQFTNLNALADEYLKLAYHGMRAKEPDFQVQLTTDFAVNLSALELAPQDMGRVLLNLYNNAFYAVWQKQQTKKMLVTSTTKETENDYQPRVWVSTLQVNGQVELRVKDNGTGIPASIRDKIFQPFFTTKPTGQGTGLGLSLSYDIVTQGHGGQIYVQSEPGQFTEFLVYLPLHS